MTDETEDLIEQARRAGQAYIDSFNGDLHAVFADLNRRSRERGCEPVALPSKPPHPWQKRLCGISASSIEGEG